MNRKKKLQILGVLLALLALGIIGLAVWIGNAKKSVTIYDFSRNIQYDEKSNYALTSADLVETEILAADVKEEYVLDPQEVIGKYITGSAYKGQHVMKQQVQTDPTYVQNNGLSELAEYRKIYLNIDYASGFAGDIKAGQTVDLMFTELGNGLTTDRTSGLVGSENGLNYVHTRIFMQNIPVYQVYCADGSVYKRKTTDPETLNKFQGNNASALQGNEQQQQQKDGSPAYVALTVTIPQYEEISARRNYGTVSMVSRFEGSQDGESLGYLVVKDGYANIFAGKGNLEYDHNVENALGGIFEENEPVKTRPGIYTFLRRMGMISMNEKQSEQYKSIYSRYGEFMKDAAGTEWESNNPDSVTDSDLLASITMEDPDLASRFVQWKLEVESLGTELMGSNVILPW